MEFTLPYQNAECSPKFRYIKSLKSTQDVLFNITLLAGLVLGILFPLAFCRDSYRIKYDPYDYSPKEREFIIYYGKVFANIVKLIQFPSQAYILYVTIKSTFYLLRKKAEKV